MTHPHALALGRALGARLNVLGVIDPDTSKATQQLRAKTAKGIDGYAQAKTWSSLRDALPYLGNTDIDLGILGIPPHFRGTTKSPADTDLQLLGMWSEIGTCRSCLPDIVRSVPQRNSHTSSAGS